MPAPALTPALTQTLSRLRTTAKVGPRGVGAGGGIEVEAQEWRQASRHGLGRSIDKPGRGTALLSDRLGLPAASERLAWVRTSECPQARPSFGLASLSPRLTSSAQEAAEAHAVSWDTYHSSWLCRICKQVVVLTQKPGQCLGSKDL